MENLSGYVITVTHGEEEGCSDDISGDSDAAHGDLTPPFLNLLRTAGCHGRIDRSGGYGIYGNSIWRAFQCYGFG